MKQKHLPGKDKKRIRVRLFLAFATVVMISLAAVGTAWFSISKTQEQLRKVLTETLPLVDYSAKLEKEAHLFALRINDFPRISSNSEYESLTATLESHLKEMHLILDPLETLGFETERVALIHQGISMFRDFMAEQERGFQSFISINHELQRAVTELREKHNHFIALSGPRIDESYKVYLERGKEIGRELREMGALLGDSDRNDEKIKAFDEKLRVGLETLSSSAAGEMRASLESIALTHLAAGLLYEAANSNDGEIIEALKKRFLAIIPKMKQLQLILTYSTPENHELVVSATPVFRYGIGDQSIFIMRAHELRIRGTYSAAAHNALAIANQLTAEINILNVSSRQVAADASSRLHKSLNAGKAIQAAAGILAVLVSVFIGWFYIDKNVVGRLSALKESMELHLKGSDAGIPLSGNDEITDMAAALQNFVTQRTEVERRLRTTVHELNAVMDNIDYGIMFMDSSLNVLLVNKAFLQMWDYTAFDFTRINNLRDLIDYSVQRDVYKVGDEEPETYLQNRLRLVVEGHEEPIEIKLQNGRVYQCRCIVLPENGRMLTYFDITEIRENQDRLIQAKKMETIGLMAGGVAHDLNNILSGIVAYPDLLLMKLPEDSDLIRPIQEIKESGRRAAAVVSDLLTVTRGAAVHREICSLNRLVEEYLLSPEGRKHARRYPHITIKTRLHRELLNLSCAPMHIKKCIMNLVMNASEAIENAGTIIIVTKNQYIDTQLLDTSTLKSGEYVVLEVSDDGPGIAEKDIDHIFEPFYSKKIMGRSGTGLGLTIVWNTVQEHNGAVTADSSPNGTVFRLFFPAARESIDQISLEPPDPDMQGKGERILVVDDEALQRDIARQILEHLGYQVETAPSGEKAVEMVSQTPYDLVILDMIMVPGINGRLTHERISEIRPEQRAIIASGYSEHDDIRSTLQQGASDFLQKPYTLAELGSTVKKALS